MNFFQWNGWFEWVQFDPNGASPLKNCQQHCKAYNYKS